MKCPRCGRDIKDNESFCPGCGYRPVREDTPAEAAPEARRAAQPPKVGRVVKTVLILLLYIGLMFGCQSCVMSGYMSSLMVGQGMSGAVSEEMILEQAESLISATEEKSVEILLISNLLTLLIVCLLFHLRKKSPVKEMGVHFVNPFRFITFAVFGTALNVFISLTLSNLPLPAEYLDAVNSQFADLYSGTSLFVQIVAVAVVSPIVEELIFRGLGMTKLTPLVGSAAAAIITALLFGFAHGTLVALLYAALLGFIFGMMYARYRSVIPSMVTHIFFNLTSFWITEIGDSEMMLLGVYVISVAMLLWCAYRIFVRYPTFNDVLSDRDSRISPINSEEAEIMARLRTLQRKDAHDIGELGEELEELERRWSENRKNHKKK